jgi:predicted transcriptional regulator
LSVLWLDKIEKAEKDISEGKVYTTEEAKQQLSNGFNTL